MFKGNGLQCYTYKIDLTVIIDPIFRLLIDIIKKQETEFIFSAFFNSRLAQTDIVDINGSEEIYITQLCKSIELQFNSSSELKANLKTSDILFLYRRNNKIYAYGKDAKTIKGIISNSLQEFDPIEELFKSITCDYLELFKVQLKTLVHIAFYKQVVTVEPNPIEIIAYPIEWAFLDMTSNVSLDLTDVDDVWINKDDLLSKFELTIDEIETVYEVREGSDVIGVKINDFFIPTTSMHKYIRTEHQLKHWWNMFQFEYQKKSKQSLPSESDILTSFKERMTDSNLNKLLSYLNCNLYVTTDNVELISGYEDYFEEVREFKNLDHLDGYNFYVPKGEVTPKPSTLLGVYSDVKKGTSYNLLHWVDLDNNRCRHFRGSNHSQKESSHIFALRPEISYYFTSKYFEDLLNSAILENRNCKFISNFELTRKDAGNPFAEIDFVIKTDCKLIFIEAKTKLSKDNIDDTIIKFTKINNVLQNMTGCNVEYYIIAAYSDDSCNYYKHFIDQSEKEFNNQERDGLKSKTYNFKIPMPEFNDVSISCIVEPEYCNLKTELLNICQE